MTNISDVDVLMLLVKVQVHDAHYGQLKLHVNQPLSKHEYGT